MERVPRYTSYPTAPHFHEGVGADQYVSWLKSLNDDNSLSLYFHIPYCKQLCWFCGCHTKIVNHYEPITRYLKLLEQEVQLISPLVKEIPVTHIHFGGGSPTVIAAEDFIHFMASVREQFDLTEGLEIAVEMDPRTVDASKIAAYAQAGVTRASLGVQDFDLTVQEAINRVQSYEMVKAVVDELRANNIEALNIDLIYGLPYQTLETTKNSIERTLSLNPDRISLFGYAHVPWMKKHQKLVPEAALPGKGARIAISGLARELLLKAGYIAIGLDHFALPQDELAVAAQAKTLQRNFQGYTTDSADALLGFGVSSISSLPQGYVQNTSGNIDYAQCIKAGRVPAQRGITLTEEDKQRRDIIMSLMCNFQASICSDRYAEELERLQPYITSGDITYTGGVVRVNPDSYNRLRLIASVFDSHLFHNTKHRYSQAV